VEVVKTATPAAGEFLEVCAVFVAVVGLGSGLGFHGVRDLRGSIELRRRETLEEAPILICLELNIFDYDRR
jgi:hypothetical protein